MSFTDLRQVAKSAIEVGLAIANGSREISRPQANRLLGALTEDLGKVKDVPEVAATNTKEAQMAGALELPSDEAVAGSLQDYISRVRGAFRTAFPGRRTGDGDVYEYWVRDVFKGHASLGDSVITEDGGHLYQVDYTEDDEGAFSFTDRNGWIEVVMTYVPLTASGDTDEDGLMELEESFTGDVAAGSILNILEGEPTGGDSTALTLEVAVVEPGWGNTRDNRYYGKEMLGANAKVFEGAKMFATNHVPGEKNVRNDVSQILECPTGFTEAGAPIARVGVYDPAFAEKVRNMATLTNADGTSALSNLHCSISGRGKMRSGFEKDGRKGFLVEKIVAVNSVDWVPHAGAGGRALNLAESEKQGGVNMAGKNKPTEEQKKDEPTEGVFSEQEEPTGGDEQETPAKTPSEEPKPDATDKEPADDKEGDEPNESEDDTESETKEMGAIALTSQEVIAGLKPLNIPTPMKQRLLERHGIAPFVNTSALDEAVKAEVEYVQGLSGSGAVSEMGSTQAVGHKPPTPAELEAGLDEVDARYGLTAYQPPAATAS